MPLWREGLNLAKKNKEFRSYLIFLTKTFKTRESHFRVSYHLISNPNGPLVQGLH